jgi:hypoxanthine-DNA glycosylase
MEFEPIIDKNTEILILGYFPGKKSIQEQKYYEDNRNKFWEIMGAVLKVEFLENKPYIKKVTILKNEKIGLWNVYKEDEILNDFSILKNFPNLKFLFFNGKKAKINFDNLNEDFENLKQEILKSSSGTYAIPLKDKITNWKEHFSK